MGTKDEIQAQLDAYKERVLAKRKKDLPDEVYTTMDFLAGMAAGLAVFGILNAETAEKGFDLLDFALDFANSLPLQTDPK